MVPRSRSITTDESGSVVFDRCDDILKTGADRLPKELVQGWIQSPRHEENMRTPHYELGGAGVDYSENKEELYATHNMCVVSP